MLGESRPQFVAIDDFPWLNSNSGRRRFNVRKNHCISKRDSVELWRARKPLFQRSPHLVHSLLSLSERAPFELESGARSISSCPRAISAGNTASLNLQAEYSRAWDENDEVHLAVWS
jgi:hypothetical protein